MICLATNYLILGLAEETQEARQLIASTEAGETLITPMLAWFELRCGPATPVQVTLMRAILRDVVVFDEPQAIEAARLFNAVGRRRTLSVDAMIASSAIVAGATLATNNRERFVAFAPHGLRLV